MSSRTRNMKQLIFYSDDIKPQKMNYKDLKELKKSQKKIIKANEKILIIDEPIAFYYAMQQENISYTLPYAIPKYHLADYDRVFYLTQRTAPAQSELVAMYLPSANNTKPAFIKRNIITYQGMRLYQIQSEQALQNLYRK
jgi:hypothetical protein